VKHLAVTILANLFLVFSIVNLSATEYYISNTGNDNARGTSIESSFKTINRLNQVKLKAGDKVYFKAGDVFTGSLHINYSGKDGKPIMLSSYGEGAKPVLNGAVALSDFSAGEDNFYSVKCDHKIQYLFKDDEVMIKARYPNEGFLTIDDGSADHLVDNDLPFDENQLKGATAHVQLFVWLYKYRTISNNTENTIEFDRSLNTNPESDHQSKTGRDYYLDNSILFLDNSNEWFYDVEDKKLHVYSTSPLDEAIEFEGVFSQNGIVLSKGVSHVKIENLKISGHAEAGIIGMGDNNDIHIQNNEFTKIGKYGIYFEKQGSEITIKDNFLHDIFGNAIRTMHANNSLIEENRIENIGKIVGYGISGLNNASGICVLNYEKHYDDTINLSRDNLIRNNLINNIGYNGIRFEGYNTICEKNIIKNCVNTLHDGGMIYTWGKDTMYTFRNIIRDNIVIGDKSQAEGSHQIQIGIYVDNNVRDVTVSNNIVTNVKGGMMTNWATTRSVFKDNLVYGANTGLTMTVLDEKCFSNHSATGNQFIITENLGSTLVIGNHRGTELNSGVIDNNFYLATK
jgi:hypothetical protein